MVRYKLKNGNTYNIFSDNDLFDLIEQELGIEIAERIKSDYEYREQEIKQMEEECDRLLEVKDEENSELQWKIKDLEEEIDRLEKEKENGK